MYSATWIKAQLWRRRSKARCACPVLAEAAAWLPDRPPSQHVCACWQLILRHPPKHPTLQTSCVPSSATTLQGETPKACSNCHGCPMASSSPCTPTHRLSGETICKEKLIEQRSLHPGISTEPREEIWVPVAGRKALYQCLSLCFHNI